MDQCLYDPCILLNSPKVKCKVDLPLLTGKVTNDVLDCNSFKALGPFLESLSLQSLEFWVVRQESCQPHIFVKYEQNNHLNCLIWGDISRKVASLNILVYAVINLLFYEHCFT